MQRIILQLPQLAKINVEDNTSTTTTSKTNNVEDNTPATTTSKQINVEDNTPATTTNKY